MSRARLSLGERLNDGEEAIRRAIENKTDNLRVAMPGTIVDFDADVQTATVQPLLKERVGGQWLTLPLLLDVPCFFPRAGGYCLTFPVKAGDECIVLFNDMCIDSWWQSGGIQAQAEIRRHDLSDAMCLLGITSVPQAVTDYSTDSMMLRNEAKSAYVEITDSGVMNIRNNIGDINVDTTQSVNVTAAQNINAEATSITATAQSVSVQASTVSIQAAQTISISANATLAISSSAPLTIASGTSVTVSGPTESSTWN